VFLFWVADHHNKLKNELIAVETDLNTRIGTGATSELKVVAGTAAAPAIRFPSGNGLYDTGAGGVQVAGASTQRVRFDSTFLVFTPASFSNVVTHVLGTAALPAIAQTSDTNTGLSWTGSDVLQVSTAGTLSASFGADVTVNKGQLLVQNGSAALPSIAFASDTDTGFSRTTAGVIEVNVDAAQILVLDGSNPTTPRIRNGQSLNNYVEFSTDTLRIVAANNEIVRLTFTASLPQVMANITSNTAANPVYAFLGDGNTGMNRPSGDRLDLCTAGVTRVYCDSAGFVGIGSTAPTSTLHASGSLAVATVLVSADTTLTAGYHTVRVDASGANRTITLPAASGCTGRVYIIKKIDATVNTVTIDGDTSETIDGATTVVISAQYQSYTIQSNGTSWDII
jgi:hypothetical protein